MQEIEIRVEKLLSFFDSERAARRHSNSVKSLIGEELLLALLVEFYKRRGEQAEVVCRTCTTGKRRGPQLDAWLRVDHSPPEGRTFYQVEVKSWSAHGVGGGSRYLPPSPSPTELAKYRAEVWQLYWHKGRFVNPGLNKVLVKMRSPVEATRILPLACLWAPVHPDGDADPLFFVSPEDADFQSVCVFSASSFLRQIREKQADLVLRLPLFAERMRWLGELFAFR